MNKLMAAFHNGAQFLGQGKRWIVFGKTVYLWPFLVVGPFFLWMVWDVWVSKWLG